MIYRKTFASVLFAFVILLPPLAFADSFTASIQNLSPGNSVMVKNKVSFSINTTGFIGQSFQIQDSFSGSSLSNTSNTYVDGGGNFQWVPLVSDVGTHNLTITARDYSGDSATTQVTITVLPPPSVSINSVSNTAISAGQKFTFSVSQSGFTNPSYIVGDAFSGSSVNSQDLDASGNFSWTPDLSQNGKHTITVYATDAQGHSAQASVDVQVGAGATLLVQIVTPGTVINAGTTVSFNVGAINFIPTGFSVSDSFSGSSVSNANVNTSGNFVWTPSGSDVGTHILTFKGQVGAFGDSATTSETLYVVAAGASTSTPPVSAPAPTATTQTAASSSLLSTLQAQLLALQTKIAAQGSGGVSNPAPSVVFDTYLKPGSTGDEVAALQKILIQLGFLSGDATGYYGSQTVDAVIKLQAAHGLTQLGVVGPATRALLNSMSNGPSNSPTTATTPAASANTFEFEHFMGYGDDDSPDVTQLQMVMQSLGYLPSGAPLGFFGSATESAVKKFQAAKGIPATGYVGSQTRAALNQ